MSEKRVTREDLLRRLSRRASVPDRLSALADLKLSNGLVSKSLGVSAESLRQWSKGSPVRDSNREVLDDLRAAAYALLDSGLEPPEVASWLTGRPDHGGDRPIELVRTAPHAVVAAARAHAAGDDEAADDILLEAGRLLAAARTLRRPGRPPLPDDTLEPTDTELKEFVLEKLRGEDDDTVKELLKRYDEYARREVPNYHAFRQLITWLRNIQEPSREIPRLYEETVRVKQAFANLGADLSDPQSEEFFIRPGSGLLTFARSHRVIQVLSGVRPEVQAACRLYVAEARPKTLPAADSRAFRDAYGTLAALGDAAYEPVVLRDADAVSLLSVRRSPKPKIDARLIDTILIGAQSVYTRNGEVQYFAGTPGTDALLRVARDNEIHVLVITDESKMNDLEDESDQDDAVERREHYEDAPWKSRSGPPLAKRAQVLSYGAEKCPFIGKFSLYTEKGVRVTTLEKAA